MDEVWPFAPSTIKSGHEKARFDDVFDLIISRIYD
jgi:hypothetical protein